MYNITSWYSVGNWFLIELVEQQLYLHPAETLSRLKYENSLLGVKLDQNLDASTQPDVAFPHVNFVTLANDGKPPVYWVIDTENLHEDDWFS
ncbi:unnamed protein product [Vicia faba]|uniref:Uncharacterized protein n=1 Tax=Vicia faba TaxID=3906 RepID=A0AAV1A8Q3_VICFA|nr:unnamed protein product [Vicia faba]